MCVLTHIRMIVQPNCADNLRCTVKIKLFAQLIHCMWRIVVLYVH